MATVDCFAAYTLWKKLNRIEQDRKDWDREMDEMLGRIMDYGVPIIRAEMLAWYEDRRELFNAICFPEGREKAFRMMIEDQVCSLELAKKLRELGVTQNSLWYWAKDGDEDVVISDEKLILAGGAPTNSNVFSAFTVAELGEMIADVAIKTETAQVSSGRDCWHTLSVFARIKASSPEADARAKFLAFLIKSEDFRADWLNR